MVYGTAPRRGSRCWARLAMAALTAVGLVGAAASSAAAAPRPNLWDRWTKHDPNSSRTVDHGAWTGLLGEHLSTRADGVAVLDYARLKRDDRPTLASYIKRLEATKVSTLNRREQFAYWVNFYNALTVRVVLDHYPVKSIRDIDISPGLLANGPWGAKLATVEGERLSLDDIEHRILRPIWKDPRIHYAVNCASISCPNLQPVAFTAQNAETLLESGARLYVNDPRGVVAQRRGRIKISSIYKWFEEDFGGGQDGVLAHLRQYAEPKLRTRLSPRSRIVGDGYDWTLNDSDARPTPSPIAPRHRFSSGAPGERRSGSFNRIGVFGS